jgi:hypothetical protein
MRPGGVPALAAPGSRSFAAEGGLRRIATIIVEQPLVSIGPLAMGLARGTAGRVLGAHALDLLAFQEVVDVQESGAPGF